MNFTPHPTIKKVAIVALGPSSHRYIEEVDHVGDRRKLFDETWTFNTYASVIASDRVFHMDDVKVQERRAAGGNFRVKNMLEALKRYPGPIYTSFPEPEYPTMEAYPLLPVCGRYNTMYFTTTPPYAVAYAGFLGIPDIYIYGCDYTWPGLAGAETGRSCMEFWVGLLKGQGHNVFVHPESTLLNASTLRRDNVLLYGYDRVKIEVKDGQKENELRVIMTEKELPTAEEIEERYKHVFPGSGVQLDVVN